MSWLGAAEALQEALVDREKKRRQAMLDAIAAEDRKERAEDRSTGRRIQEAQLQQFEDVRKSQAEAARVAASERVANLLSPDADVDPETARVLTQGGMGSLLQKHGARSVPIMLPGGGMTQAGVPIPERQTFKGTAAQHALRAKAQAEKEEKASGRASTEEQKQLDRESRERQNEADNARSRENAQAIAAFRTASRNTLTPTAESNLISKLATQWTKATAQARELKRQFRIMEAGVTRFNEDPNGASQAVLVTFQKMLDPTSVVRESEYARSAAGIALQQRIVGYMEKLRAGGAGVPLAQLREMVKTAELFRNNTRDGISGVRRRIEANADRYNIPSELVFDDDAPPAQGGGANAPIEWERGPDGKLRQKAKS